MRRISSRGRRIPFAAFFSPLLLLLTAAAPEAPIAPDFELQLLGGDKVALGDLNGRIVVLNFWATWCVPCRRELPEMDAVQKEAGTRIAIFAIDVDRVARRPVTGRAPVTDIPIVSRVVRGSADYRPIRSAIPSTYVIDARGRLILAKAGAFAPGEFRQLMRSY